MNESALELLRLGLALGGAFIAMTWIALVLWVYRDCQSRTAGVLPTLLATTLVAATYAVGWIIYLLLRPRLTLHETYRQRLEDRRAVLGASEGDLCPRCDTRIHLDFRLCPNCGLDLKQPCDVCKRPVRTSWNLCPYCGHAQAHALPLREP